MAAIDGTSPGQPSLRTRIAALPVWPAPWRERGVRAWLVGRLFPNVAAHMVSLEQRTAVLGAELQQLRALAQQPTTALSDQPPDVLVGAALDALAEPGARGRLAAQAWLASIGQRSLEVAGAIEQHLTRDEHAAWLLHLLLMVGRTALADTTMQKQVFDGGERMGVHLLPARFYSPVPVLGELGPATWQPYDLAGVDWRPADQRAALVRLGRWADELAAFPSEAADARGGFFYNNSAIGPMDASVYYATIRERRPKRVLEVGGGYSTMLAAEAARRNGDTVLDCIEPYPMDGLPTLPGLHRLLDQGVQSVPLAEFTSLQAGDILFIDCSHVSKVGSDVNHLLLRVLPHLAEGVLVHIHDIFLPAEYPEPWVKDLLLFWNEQYLVHAFLLFNAAFRVVLANAFVGATYADDVRQTFPMVTAPGGGSLWLERQAR